MMRGADVSFTSHAEIADRAAAGLERLRDERPRVHCLTNFVAMQLSANLLLAVGAVPSMTMEPAAMPDFVGSSQGLLVNLGMLDPWRREAAPEAIRTAQSLGRPWVLDPVKVDRSAERRAFAQSLLDLGPAVLRCNRAERPFLEARDRSVVSMTGAVDRIVWQDRAVDVEGGSPLMDRVTAMGCAGSALVAAFLAVEEDPFVAAASAMLVMKAAGSMAAETASGPGSFVPAFLDAVYRLDAAALQRHARLA
jgi:hydroxyethylthiazole kinase